MKELADGYDAMRIPIDRVGLKKMVPFAKINQVLQDGSQCESNRELLFFSLHDSTNGERP